MNPSQIVTTQVPAGAAPPDPRSFEALTLISRDERTGVATFRRPNGEIVTAALAPADVTNQREQLDTYLGGFQPFGFAADDVAPVVLVNKEKGDRRDLGEANAFERVNTKVGRHGAINTVDLISGLGTYHTQEYGLASFLPWQSENDRQENFNVRAHIGQMLLWKLALDREFRVKDLVTATSSWHADNVVDLTGQATLKWDTGNAKNPRADLHAALKSMLMPATGVWMNPDVAFHLLSDDEIRDFMRQMLGDNAPSPDVAKGAAAGAMGVVTLRIPGLVADAPIHIVPAKALDVSTGSVEYIWPDDVVITSNPPGQPSDGMRMASALTYRTRGRSGSGVVSNEYIPQGRGINSGSMFEVGYSDHELITGSRAGALMKHVLA